MALATVGVAGGPPQQAEAAVGGPVAITWSSEDGSARLTDRPGATLQSRRTAADVTINVDPQARYQTLLGEGGVLESSSVWNIAHLSPAKRDQMMRQLFDPASGNGYDVVRLAMGCADMCAESFYTYDDRPTGETDPDLKHFSIQKDIDAGIVALARQARQINPEVRFYLSMWSAPAWMKTNGSLINGGQVRPEYYPALARYQRRAIQAYQAQGVPIHAMTPQNEPDVVMPYPSGSWSGTQMRDYVRDHLGPELVRNGVGTQVWVGDANPPELKRFLPPILDDPAAAQYVSAIAVHDYSRDDPSVLSELRLRHPGLPLHLTERSYYGINGERHKVSGEIQSGIRRVIDLYRNGLSSWTYWITFLDTAGKPNTGPLDASCCAVPFTAPPRELDAYTTNRDYYLYGQFSRYLRHGAERVGSDQTSTEVSNVVFRNPDLSMVAVVANGADQPRTIAVTSPDGTITDTLPPMTVGTYRWASNPPAADPQLGTFRLVNRADPGLALQSAGDHYPGSQDSFAVAATPAGWNGLEQQWVISSAGNGYYRLTSSARQSTVLHTTGEKYRDWPDVWNTATTPSSLHWDEQLWRIVDRGDGYVSFVNKARGTALQSTNESYSDRADVRTVVSSPMDWGIAQQQWRLVR
jgi:glucosylceramidase